MMAVLRSTLLNLVLFGSVPLWGAAFFAVSPGPARWRIAVSRHWARTLLLSVKRICGLGYRVEYEGRLPDQPCVVYWKHESAWEVLAGLNLFGDQAWVLKRELLLIPIFGWAVSLLGGIGIDRQGGRRAVRQVVHEGKRRLDEGAWVMIFPEGRRMWPGTTKRYGRSGAVLACEAGVPILPIAHNVGDYWRRRAYVKQPGTVTIRIGEPIETRGRDPLEVNLEAHRWIESRMREIAPQRRYEPVSVEEAVVRQYPAHRRALGSSGEA